MFKNLSMGRCGQNDLAHAQVFHIFLPKFSLPLNFLVLSYPSFLFFIFPFPLFSRTFVLLSNSLCLPLSVTVPLSFCLFISRSSFPPSVTLSLSPPANCFSVLKCLTRFLSLLLQGHPQKASERKHPHPWLHLYQHNASPPHQCFLLLV